MQNNVENTNAKWLVMILTIVAFAVGAVLWATNSHSELREWTAEQDFVTKTELKEMMKDQYVPFYIYIETITKLKNKCESSDKIELRLNRIEKKLESKSKHRR